MSTKPKIPKKIKELIRQSHNSWAYYCLGQDIEYESEHLMNIFAGMIIEHCIHNMENCDGDLDFAIYKTKKDFGVE